LCADTLANPLEIDNERFSTVFCLSGRFQPFQAGKRLLIQFLCSEIHFFPGKIHWVPESDFAATVLSGKTCWICATKLKIRNITEVNEDRLSSAFAIKKFPEWIGTFSCNDDRESDVGLRVK
jgi:hypothetical protein